MYRLKHVSLLCLTWNTPILIAVLKRLHFSAVSALDNQSTVAGSALFAENSNLWPIAGLIPINACLSVQNETACFPLRSCSTCVFSPYLWLLWFSESALNWYLSSPSLFPSCDHLLLSPSPFWNVCGNCSHLSCFCVFFDFHLLHSMSLLPPLKPFYASH